MPGSLLWNWDRTVRMVSNVLPLYTLTRQLEILPVIITFVELKLPVQICLKTMATTVIMNLITIDLLIVQNNLKYFLLTVEIQSDFADF
jgi:hypothetical protein